MRGKGRRLVMECGSMLVVKVDLHRRPEMVRQPVAWMKHVWKLRIRFWPLFLFGSTVPTDNSVYWGCAAATKASGVRGCTDSSDWSCQGPGQGAWNTQNTGCTGVKDNVSKLVSSQKGSELAGTGCSALVDTL